MKYTIDAQDKKLGRVASEAAKMLMGKQTTAFARNIVPEVTVEIVNASKIILDPKKIRDTILVTYSGYPGGIKTKTVEQFLAKKGYAKLFEDTVYGMLPINKLRSKMIKNLVVTD